MKKTSLLFLGFLFSLTLYGQEELMALLDAEDTEDKGFVSATFKGTRVINGHSIETRTNGVLEFIISHRFGALNTGYEEFWGLDFANIRLGLEYGITD
ncbi:MAG: hypothetical protein HRT61_18580, partial [Ekhidna sp.]|nr:hypothetical protein [Ekhidna sp.]